MASFTLNFHRYEHTYEPIYRIFFVVSSDQQRCAEADRDPQNIGDSRNDCGEKNSYGIARFSCASTAFLFLFWLYVLEYAS